MRPAIKDIRSVTPTTNCWELDLRRLINHANIELDYQTEFSTHLPPNRWTMTPCTELFSKPATNNPDYETVRIALQDALVTDNTNLFIRASYQ